MKHRQVSSRSKGLPLYPVFRPGDRVKYTDPQISRKLGYPEFTVVSFGPLRFKEKEGTFDARMFERV
jgi:hypothetical protein